MKYFRANDKSVHVCTGCRRYGVTQWSLTKGGFRNIFLYLGSERNN
jgi:hypothetical protein